MPERTVSGRPQIAPDGGTAGRCDFCRSPIPVEPITTSIDGVEYSFCTQTCRESAQRREQVFTAYRGYRWLEPGVAALDARLPQGLLRNSTVLVSAHPGARETELQSELLWRSLRRDEPAVLVSFQEPPVSAIGRLLDMDWNVLPYLESGDLRIVDCFTYRVDDRTRMLDRMNDWNAHLRSVAEPSITAVRDPTTPSEILSALDGSLERSGMIDRGVVVVDSLTEFGSIVQPVRAYNLAKDLRATVSKGRFVPVFAGGSYMGDGDQFPHDLEYMFDGIVDLELNPKIVENTLIKRLRVRKMNGVLTYPEWTAYEFTSDDGLVMFDPAEEIAKSEAERAAADDSPDDGEDDEE